jgi:hypothetical protein
MAAHYALVCSDDQGCTLLASTRSVRPGVFHPESAHSTVCSVLSSARMLSCLPLDHASSLGLIWSRRSTCCRCQH